MNASSVFMALVVCGPAATPGFAHSYGPAARLTAAPGEGSVSIILHSGSAYIPGVRQRITVLVADATQQRRGFELYAWLNSDNQTGQAGELIPIDNLTSGHF